MFSATAIANFLACHQIATLDRAESRGEIRSDSTRAGADTGMSFASAGPRKYLVSPKHVFRPDARNHFTRWRMVKRLSLLHVVISKNGQADVDGVLRLNEDGKGFWIWHRAIDGFLAEVAKKDRSTSRERSMSAGENNSTTGTNRETGAARLSKRDYVHHRSVGSMQEKRAAATGLCGPRAF